MKKLNLYIDNFLKMDYSLKVIFMLFLLIYLVSTIFIYNKTDEYAKHEAMKRVQEILLDHKATHSYIEEMQKPVIYQLKKDKKLYSEFFQPEILSFTFIARNMHNYHSSELKKAGREPYYYKLASTNPRNPINQANKLEDKILKLANEDKLKEYKEIIKRDGKNYLYYAVPINKNKESCMKCHGEPSTAPKEMLDRYGEKRGFYERVGEIRAIISLEVPMEHQLKEAREIFYFLATILAVIMSIVFLLIMQQKRINEFIKSEKEKQEALLIQQSKMASMGEMIGAIAHQLKQPLNSIGLIVQSTNMKYKRGILNEETMKEATNKSLIQIDFMSKTIDSFRNFFKPDKEKIEFNIKNAIEDILSILSTQLKNNSIEVEFQGEYISIVNYENEFKQVILNLITNAKDAIIERQKKHENFNGKIEISILQEASKVYIKVKDNGGGIKKDVLNKIFEAYFTTKGESGTGIGLHMSKMIIESDMAGKLTAYSKGDESEFKIELNI